jgi:hypothetical protein
MWKRKCEKLLAVLLLVLSLALGSVPLTAKAATKEQIDESLARGIEWLIDQQQADGSWTRDVSPGTQHQAGATGFAVSVLCHYAERLGLEPLSPAYAYSTNVQEGLNYLFSAAHRDEVENRVWWEDGGGYSNYESGPPLMAISRTHAAGTVVDVPDSPVNGMTYRQVAQEVVNFFDYTQGTTGTYFGAWGYHGPDSGSDQSATGWVVLGLGYAKHSFGLSLPEGLLEGLSTYIDYIQYTPDPADAFHGGSGYWVPDQWINIYKTGHLIYEMALVGDSVETPRVQWALDFLKRHWDVPNSGQYGHTYTVNGHPDIGWKGGTEDPPSPLPSYIATATVMKGLLLLGVDSLDEVDWYDQFADIIMANQNEDGSWDQGGYPTYGKTLSTNWALMTMLRATSTPEPPASSGSRSRGCTIGSNGAPNLEWVLLLGMAFLGYIIRRRKV